MNGWLRPHCDSRTGSSHRRRGVPCQDASGWHHFLDAAGEPVLVLVVSDGHGGARYDHSDVGSQRACRVALEEVERRLAGAQGAQPGGVGDWQQWLAEELPLRILESWRREVKAHWRAEPPPGAPGFSPIPYGATLGLVVLTPHWWGHSGLGDWDLARIEASGEATLMSEEPQAVASGESTFSLCMESAARHFAPRTALHPLTQEEPPFSLLLSTDGIRKSCSTDADYLTLARYLADLPIPGRPRDAAELAAALDRISSLGSGDDVSVAIGRWGPLHGSWPGKGGAAGLHIVQPAPPQQGTCQAGKGPGSSASAERADGDTTRKPAAPPRPSPIPGPAPRGWFLWAGGVVVLSLLAAGALFAARLWGWGPSGATRLQAPALSVAQRNRLKEEAENLCRPYQDAGPSSKGGAVAKEPTRSSLALQIGDALNQRKSIFSDLLQRGEPAAAKLLKDYRSDPLSALIAWSYKAESPQAGNTHGSGAEHWQGIDACPDLQAELKKRWQPTPRKPAAGNGANHTQTPSPHATGSPPPRWSTQRNPEQQPPGEAQNRGSATSDR